MPDAASSSTGLPRPALRQRVLRGVLLGAPGILSLLLVAPALPNVPRAALLVNPVLLLALMALAGAACASRAGFRSMLLAGDPIVRPLPALARQVAAGSLLGVGFAILDQALAPFWREASSVNTLLDGWSAAQFVAGVLYGGITEEIVMRWGFMSLVVWLWLRLPGAGRRSALIVGLIVSSAAFSAAHLPTLLLEGWPSTALLLRTLGLNFLLGLAFGWTYLRLHLEAAMALHGGFHIGVALAAMAFPLLLR